MKKLSRTHFSWPSRNSGHMPVWVAAHSPISKFDLKRTVQLFGKYEEAGVALLTTGEIVLDCMDARMMGPVIRMKALRGEANSPMGFYLLGPAEPNLLPADVGIELCKAAIKCCQLPVVANIGCFKLFANQEEQLDLGIVEDNLKKIIDTGVSAFELALSCPNLDHQRNKSTWWEENFRLIEIIRKHSELPVSLKISRQNLKNIQFKLLFKFCKNYGVTQITTFDAIRLVCPPKVDENAQIHFPFHNYPALCYTGAHGPWNRFLLYDSVATIKAQCDKYAANTVSLSAVGGIMTAEHVFEAMVLGADNVQLSSVLFWHGIERVRKIIAQVQKQLAAFNENMDKLQPTVDSNTKEGLEKIYGKEYVDEWFKKNVVSTTNLDKCIGCQLCCKTPCLSREFKHGMPEVNSKLCSGCGWCKEICPVSAIAMQSA